MRIVLACLFLIHLSVYAELDEHSQKGLSDTKALLKNPGERQKVINADPKARATDEKVGALAGSSENKEEIYDLASQLMEKITVEADGDPAKMQALLLEAQKNPQAFYDKMFTAEQKTRVRGVSGKIEATKAPIRPKK